MKSEKCPGTQWIPIDAIQPNPVQPLIRHEESAVKALKEQIEATGLISPITVVRSNGNYIMVDGERRRTVAKLLNKSQIEAVVLPEADAESIFARLNSGTRRMSGKEWFAAWGRATDRKVFETCMPQSLRTHVREVVKIWGLAGALELSLEEKYSPNIAVSVNVLSGLFEQKQVQPKTGRIADKQIGNWLLAHNAQRYVKDFAKIGPNSTQVRRLYNAVAKDAPFPKSLM